jgi:hypothetical protein
MGNLTPFGLSPFDILIKDFFNSDTEFRPAHQTKINHPVDIYEANDGLNIDILKKMNLMYIEILQKGHLI